MSENLTNIIIEKLRDEWYTYEEEYDKLNQWIKDTETEMKADSELKATLEEKNIQLERHNVSYGENTSCNACKEM